MQYIIIYLYTNIKSITNNNYNHNFTWNRCTCDGKSLRFAIFGENKDEKNNSYNLTDNDEWL